MKAIKNSIIGKAFLVFALVCLLVGSIDAMQPSTKKFISIKSKNAQRQIGLESVWVQTSDGQKIEVPKWQIDQMKVLQVLFVHKKGKNSKKMPVDASMVTAESLMLMQKALNIAGNLGEFTLFCANLTSKEKAYLTNAAFAVEAIGLASLLAEETFSPEIQDKLGATVPGIIEPVVNYFNEQNFSEKNFIGSTHTYDAKFSSDSMRIVSVTEHSIRHRDPLILWNAKTRKIIKILKGHQAHVECAAFSPDGEYIVSGGYGDNDLILWNGKTGEQIKILQSRSDAVRCVAFSPNGEYIVSGASVFEDISDKNNLILWNGKTGEQIKILQHGLKNTINCVAFSPDGKYIVSGAFGDNNLILWNGKTGDWIKSLQGHQGGIFCLIFSPDGKYIVSGSADNNNNLILWNGETGDLIKRLEGHPGHVCSVAFSSNGKYIVSGSVGNNNNLILWDGETGGLIKTLEGHDAGQVQCVAFSPNDEYIASGSNSEIIIWDSKTKEPIKKLVLSGLNCLAFSPDGLSLIAGSTNLSLWEIFDQKALDFVKKELTLSQARFLYRLYLAMLNKVPAVIDEHDQDYATYKSLPDNVKKLIDMCLPFQLASKTFAQMMQEKKQIYKPLFAGLTTQEKIAKIKQIMDAISDKNSVGYKACQELLNEFETEAAFED